MGTAVAQAAVPAIATGAVHGLALRSDGTVRAWGSDAAGELGVGRVLSSTSPIAALDGSGFSSVSAGLGFTLALKADGTVWSWGDNSAGLLGDGTTQSRSRPRRIPGLAGVASIAAGHNHAAVVKTDGTVWAWGYNASGAVGNGSGGVVTSPVQVSNLAGVVAVAVGIEHTLALKSDGTVWAWGNNQSGALGDGTTTNRYVPVQVPGLTGMVAISATSHSVALRNDGSVWVWGPNHVGQLGDGGSATRYSPFRLTSITGVSAISAGDRHTLALRSGEVWSWGEGVYFQLGNGAASNRAVPGKVTGLAGVTAVWAGRGYHGFARLADGTLRAWGFNAYGQLGDGTTADRALPTTVVNVSSPASFSAGFYHTAAIVGGAIIGWGDNSAGQLGEGTPVTRATPMVVGGAANVTAIAAGTSHSLALRADGTVIAWGSNSDGVLGDGTTTSRASPVVASGVTGASAIAAGMWHSLALRSGTVWGWGNNQEGQLGDNTFVTSRSTAVQAVGLTGVSAISAAFLHSAALRSGEVWTWGHNGAGQLGDGTLTRRATPGRVSGLAGVTAISAGGDWYDNGHMLALRAGQVWAWGSNQRGQLGDGTTTQRLTPVLVSGLSNVIAISAGGGHSVALRSDGTVWSWGYNYSGQLGDGSTTNRLVPVQVPGLAGIVAIAAGREFTMALKGDGTVLAWGWGHYGSIGDGAYVTRIAPVVVVSEAGAGALDANNWYLRLSTTPTTVPAAFTPPMMAIAQQASDGALDATVRYRQSELDRAVNHYVLGLVPPEFFGMVDNAAANVPPIEALRSKSVNGLVLAQLTPRGWEAVTGSLDAFSQGTSNAAGSSTRILSGVPLGSLPNGTRFCVGYGDSSQSMLGASALREVMRIGAPSSIESGVPCVLSGVYLDGPRDSFSGSPVTFNASVVGASPSGTLQFRDGSVNLQSPVALAAANPAVSRASITTSSLSVGQHSIIARYSGDAANTWGPTADVTPLVHTVASAQAGTRVALSGPASSNAADEVAFVATITGDNPTGTVQFRDGASPLGAPVPIVAGQATLRTGALAIGSHELTAAFSGDASNAPSTSAALTHTVYAVVVTRVAITSSLNPATSGDTVTFTATVTGNNPTGNVTFRAGGASLGTASMGGGVASLSTASLTAGTHPIVADYGGDANNQRVTSSALSQVIRLPVTRSASTTTLGASPSPSTLAQPVTFTAGVSAPTPPTGTVTFRVAAAPIAGCGAVTLAGGSATCRTNALAAGTHSITAAYSGNDNVMPSTSLALSHRVEAAATPLAASPASLEFGGQSMNTTSPALVARFTNSGASAVTVSAVTAPAGFVVGAHDCGTLAAGAGCNVPVHFTPHVEGAFDGLLAVSHTGGGPAVARLAGMGERSLVTHYYRSILRRAGDAGGYDYWSSEAARVAGLGANLNETWYAMALEFFNSAEYRNFARDDAGFLADLYATFFNREPDSGGLHYWKGLIADGMPREVVLVSFLFSPEFASFTQAIFGNTAARAEVDMVVDFYRGLLSRLPDSGGFHFWSGQFRTAQCQSPAAIYAQVEAISSAYLNSPEYAARNRTAAQFVGDMYNAFMRRGGDLAGVRFWISQLDSGARSREDVRRSFISTPEFAARVQAVVAQGCQR